MTKKENSNSDLIIVNLDDQKERTSDTIDVHCIHNEENENLNNLRRELKLGNISVTSPLTRDDH